MGTREPLPLVMGQKVNATIRGEKFNIAIRGWREGLYIIVDLPTVGGENFRVAPQTGCSINYIREGTFVAFKTNVNYAFVQAVTLMILEYPKNFDIHNLRKNERFKTNFPVDFVYSEDDLEVTGKGIIRDVSLSGMLITHPKLLEKNSRITVTAEFPNGTLKHQDAIVKNIRKNPKSGVEVYVTGLQWANIGENNAELLNSFLAARNSDRRKSPR